MEYITFAIEAHLQNLSRENINHHFYKKSLELHDLYFPYNEFYRGMVIQLMQCEKILKEKTILRSKEQLSEVHVSVTDFNKQISHILYKKDLQEIKSIIIESNQFIRETICFVTNNYTSEIQNNLTQFTPLLTDYLLYDSYKEKDDINKVDTVIETIKQNELIEPNEEEFQKTKNNLFSSIISNIDSQVHPEIIDFFITITSPHKTKKVDTLIAKTAIFGLLLTKHFIRDEKYQEKIPILEIFLNTEISTYYEELYEDTTSNIFNIFKEFELENEEVLQAIIELISFTQSIKNKYKIDIKEAETLIINNLNMIKSILENEIAFEKENTKTPIDIQKSRKVIFKETLIKNNFLNLKTVKDLSEKGLNTLIDLLIDKKMAYGIAMFNFLGYCDFLDIEMRTKVKANTFLSRLYNTQAKDDSTARHYRNSLISNKERYPSYNHIETVKEDYNKLK